MIARGYLPLTEVAVLSDTNCFLIVLRKPEQFALDRANGKDPKAGENCARISMLIYWEGVKVHFDAPNR